MSQPGYIFIAGLPRTGTTLTRNILNCSDDVGIGGESRFLVDSRRLGFQIRRGFRYEVRAVGEISTDVGAKKVVDYIYGIQENNFWGKIAKNVDREEFLCRLLESDRSERSLMDLAMAFHAKGKPVRGEKTPAHIYSVPTLVEWFPNAKIIHTFRDPRAIHVSQKKKPRNREMSRFKAFFQQFGLIFELYSSIHVISTWLHAIRLHYRYQQLYPNNYYLCKYEDLITNPDASLRKLCDFLGIDFIDTMLQQTIVNSSFVPRNKVQGFDTQAIDRWRKHLHPLINKWFVLWCKKQLLEFGYQT